VKIERSISAFARARRTIAGGVNSPVRAFKAVGGSPVFARSGAGAYMTDLDGHEYIDYVLSFAPSRKRPRAAVPLAFRPKPRANSPN
jgi:glutamate-1-semialdehyde aminotransferase